MLGNDIFGYVRAIALSIFRQTKIKPEAVNDGEQCVGTIYTAFDVDKVTRSKGRQSR